MQESICSVANCDAVVWVKVRGFCRSHYKAWRRHGDPAGLPDPTCKTCGQVFARPGRSGVLPAYCSRECNPATKPRFVACRFCGDEFDRRGANRVHCSTRCRDRWRRNGHKPLAEHQRTCAGCGQDIDFSQIGEHGRTRRLDANYCLGCRRNANYGLTVHDLVLRDGPNCSLCQEPVDLDIPWPQPLCPTVDHVIPWSVSRSNAPENLALAHFTCNLKKRDAVA